PPPPPPPPIFLMIRRPPIYTVFEFGRKRNMFIRDRFIGCWTVCGRRDPIDIFCWFKCCC
ncbi:hypothetical protein ACVGXP_11615, partial [Enterobacter hormaechei]